MLAIDPMHNLFLGTAKHMLKLRFQLDLVKKHDLPHLQMIVDKMVVPKDIGRIPRKVQTAFSGFTADRFKNWVILYSIPALYRLLPSEHLECWRHFVLACRILCKNSLSSTDLTLADILLIKFCTRVERLYGEAAVTPNMDLHGHLCNVLKDCGPVQEFWLFSFERYNGLLGNQPTNNRMIEPQLMKRFLRDNFANAFSFPADFFDEFNTLCQFNEQCIRGSNLQTLYNPMASDKLYDLPTRSTRGILSTEDQSFVSLLYSRLNNVQVHVNAIYHIYYYKAVYALCKPAFCLFG